MYTGFNDRDQSPIPSPELELSAMFNDTEEKKFHLCRRRGYILVSEMLSLSLSFQHREFFCLDTSFNDNINNRCVEKLFSTRYLRRSVAKMPYSCTQMRASCI